MKLQRGFTLIETMAVGLLSTIVAGALLTVLYLTNSEIKQGIVHLELVNLQSVVSEQIRKSARTANGVLLTDEAKNEPVFRLDLNTYSGAKEIRFCNSNGNVFAKYQIHSGDPSYLEEWHTGLAKYQPFLVSDDTVYVDGDASVFTILPGRRGVKFTIAHRREEKIMDNIESFSLPPIEETVLCRNNTRY
jgi:type II secretory pathway pseudopilin PulG